MPKDIKVPPPPNHSPITQEEANVEWKNWFSLLYDVLDAKGILSNPSSTPGGDDPVFWHKFYDPAWMHIAVTATGTDIVASTGQVLDGWEVKITDDWQLTSDLAAGTVTIDSSNYDETGFYYFNVGGYATGTSNVDYTISVYIDGVITAIHIPVSFKGNQTSTAFNWSGVVKFDTDAVIDLRVSSGGTLTIPLINWSMHRISPIVGS